MQGELAGKRGARFETGSVAIAGAEGKQRQHPGLRERRAGNLRLVRLVGGVSAGLSKPPPIAERPGAAEGAVSKCRVLEAVIPPPPGPRKPAVPPTALCTLGAAAPGCTGCNEGAPRRARLGAEGSPFCWLQ